jgi:mono/diheme cytochrome c family protein
MRKHFTILASVLFGGLVVIALDSQALPIQPAARNPASPANAAPASAAKAAPEAALAPAPTADALDASFHAVVQPFIQANCVECHGTEDPKAGLNLGSYTSLNAVTRDYRRWNIVLGKLTRGEMPPDDADQHPTAAQVKPVIEWIRGLQAYETQHNAGDPGLVLARRLSNAEYDYTIRDLTGQDIQPTKEFPVDPANEAGFDNSGESLAMSPELVKKYLDAAQLVANHIVFKPEGFAFSPMAMVTDEDRDNYAVHRVVDFYKQQGLSLNQQFDTYVGESLDYADYFQAAWRFQNRAALGRPAATLADFANEAKLSPKYLGKIWTTLTASGETVGPIAAVQARWRALPTPADGKEPGDVRVGCGYIRDLIVGLRPLVTQKIANLVPNSNRLADGSQTLVLWKDRQYATNRMTYPGNAQQLDMSGYAQTDPALLIPATDGDRAKYEDSFKEFCAIFPDAFVVWERARMFLTNPNDIKTDLSGHRLLTAGFHSQMGYFRDDQPLCDLVLDESQQRQLDQLWQELTYITQQPIRQYKQFMWFERGEPPSLMMAPEFNDFRPEDDNITSPARVKDLGDVYLTKLKNLGLSDQVQQIAQDYFVTMNGNIRALEQAQKAAEPSQLKALVDFAQRAFRRPLSNAERDDMLAFYNKLRSEDISHEDAIRYSVVSVLMSPSFCFRMDLPDDKQNPGQDVQPLSDYELASRLSYFLWSSMPDAELLSHAAAGDLHRPEVLLAQARRMVQDDRIRDLATEFGGNWLDIRRFEEDNAVDRDHFPTFTDNLREAMFQEPIRFFVDVARRNSSVLDFLYGNYTFVNPILAQHYGMPAPTGGADDWERVDDAQKYQRGGLLPMAVFLTKNAPGLRTSPVKRGFWVVSKLLGEYIPAPPPNVPAIPSDETKLGNLTLRETLAQHHADPNCASCHEKFDAFGLVFEGFGPIGEARTLDLGNRPVETDATFPDGTNETGVAGLRDYLHTKAQDEFLDNLSRKLLVYALSRSLQPSDEPLIADMRQKLTANGHRFDTLIESIITSPQFLMKRCPPAS